MLKKYLTRSSRKTIALLVTIFFSAENILLANITQANLWGERQRAVKAVERSQQANEEFQQALENPAMLLASLPKVESGLAMPLSSKALSDLGINVDLHNDKKASLANQYVPEWIQRAIAPTATVHGINLSKKPNAKTVLMMQDAHMHFEAQTNIAATIDSLSRALKSRNSHLLVGMEAADIDAVDFSAYNAYKNRDTMHEVAEALLRANLINGVEYAAIGFKGDKSEGAVELPFAVTGVEDWNQYKENVKALRAAVPLKDKAKTAIEDMKRVLVDLKKNHYNEDLHKFDAKLTGFEEGTIGVPEYVVYLDSIISVTTRNLKELISAALLEGSIDFDKVERERTKILETLIAKMSEAETKTLLQYSTLFKAGEVSYTGYYDHLKKLASRHGVDFSKYTEMSLYVQYVLKSEAIDHNGLFDEIKVLEDNVQRKLASTKEQQEIASLNKEYHLLNKLTQHILTEDEWHAYEKRRTPIQSMDSRLASLGSSLPKSMAEMKSQWTVFEDFYKHALARNHTMAAKLAKKLESSSAQYGLLVSGGFHTNGLVDDLKKAGFTVLTVSPKITQVEENGASTIDVLASGRLPLDQIFVGEKLFLNAPGATAQPAQAANLAGMANAMAGFVDLGGKEYAVAAGKVVPCEIGKCDPFNGAKADGGASRRDAHFDFTNKGLAGHYQASGARSGGFFAGSINTNSFDGAAKSIGNALSAANALGRSAFNEKRQAVAYQEYIRMAATWFFGFFMTLALIGFTVMLGQSIGASNTIFGSAISASLLSVLTWGGEEFEHTRSDKKGAGRRAGSGERLVIDRTGIGVRLFNPDREATSLLRGLVAYVAIGGLTMGAIALYWTGSWVIAGVMLALGSLVFAFFASMSTDYKRRTAILQYEAYRARTRWTFRTSDGRMDGSKIAEDWVAFNRAAIERRLDLTAAGDTDAASKIEIRQAKVNSRDPRQFGYAMALIFQLVNMARNGNLRDAEVARALLGEIDINVAECDYRVEFAFARAAAEINWIIAGRLATRVAPATSRGWDEGHELPDEIVPSRTEVVGPGGGGPGGRADVQRARRLNKTQKVLRGEMAYADTQRGVDDPEAEAPGVAIEATNEGVADTFLSFAMGVPSYVFSGNLGSQDADSAAARALQSARDLADGFSSENAFLDYELDRRNGLLAGLVSTVEYAATCSGSAESIQNFLNRLQRAEFQDRDVAVLLAVLILLKRGDRQFRKQLDYTLTSGQLEAESLALLKRSLDLPVVAQLGRTKQAQLGSVQDSLNVAGSLDALSDARADVISLLKAGYRAIRRVMADPNTAVEGALSPTADPARYGAAFRRSPAQLVLDSLEELRQGILLRNDGEFDVDEWLLEAVAILREAIERALIGVTIPGHAVAANGFQLQLKQLVADLTETAKTLVRNPQAARTLGTALETLGRLFVKLEEVAKEEGEPQSELLDWVHGFDVEGRDNESTRLVDRGILEFKRNEARRRAEQKAALDAEEEAAFAAELARRRLEAANQRALDAAAALTTPSILTRIGNFVSNLIPGFLRGLGRRVLNAIAAPFRWIGRLFGRRAAPADEPVPAGRPIPGFVGMSGADTEIPLRIAENILGITPGSSILPGSVAVNLGRFIGRLERYKDIINGSEILANQLGIILGDVERGAYNERPTDLAATVTDLIENTLSTTDARRLFNKLLVARANSAARQEKPRPDTSNEQKVAQEAVADARKILGLDPSVRLPVQFREVGELAIGEQLTDKNDQVIGVRITISPSQLAQQAQEMVVEARKYGRSVTVQEAIETIIYQAVFHETLELLPGFELPQWYLARLQIGKFQQRNSGESLTYQVEANTPGLITTKSEVIAQAARAVTRHLGNDFAEQNFTQEFGVTPNAFFGTLGEVLRSAPRVSTVLGQRVAKPGARARQAATAGGVAVRNNRPAVTDQQLRPASKPYTRSGVVNTADNLRRTDELLKDRTQPEVTMDDALKTDVGRQNSLADLVPVIDAFSADAVGMVAEYIQSMQRRNEAAGSEVAIVVALTMTRSRFVEKLAEDGGQEAAFVQQALARGDVRFLFVEEGRDDIADVLADPTQDQTEALLTLLQSVKSRLAQAGYTSIPGISLVGDANAFNVDEARLLAELLIPAIVRVSLLGRITETEARAYKVGA